MAAAAIPTPKDYIYKVDPEPNGLAVSKPNLIFFMPDQLRYDALGYTGNNIVKTPNIDAFAARGTRFTNCFVQASVCSQSRCSMFTGQYPHVTGHRSIDNLLKPWEPNIFRSLKENGYHVACLAPRGDTFAPTVTEVSLTEYGFLETPEFGMPNFKGAWAAKVPPEKRDDIWSRLFYKGKREDNEAYDYDEWAIRSAETWLKNPPKEPWVLFIPLIFPHCPFSVEEPYFSMYNRSDMPTPAQSAERTGYEPEYMQLIRERYGTDRATPEMWAEVMATYYGMITRLDDQFGRIISLLVSQNLFSKTVTMFFTDHGEYLGDYGLIEKWPSGLSDSLVHEPLIIAGAGLPEGKVNNDMVEMIDLVPTVLQLCGIGEHWTYDAVSLVRTLLTGEPHWKRYAFSEGGFRSSEEPLVEQAPWPYDIKAALQHQRTELVGKAVAVRSTDWTYIYRMYEPAELYSRKGDDPHELHNLAKDPEYEIVVYTMKNAVLRWMVETTGVMPVTRDPRSPEVKLESPKSQFERRLREKEAAKEKA